MKRRIYLLCSGCIVVVISVECIGVEGSTAEGVIDGQGTVRVPSFSVPLSEYMSDEAKRRFIYNLDHHPVPKDLDTSDPGYIPVLRRAVDDWLLPKVNRARNAYAINTTETVIGGVHVNVVEPKSGIPKENRGRVLLNLHGGGFVLGAGLHGLAESIPVAGTGGVRVLAIDYRMAPEHRFPAASEDVASVYKELLKVYGAKNIGIYGCSAGGTLAAMSVAWFQQHNLPVPGAIAILSGAAFGNFYAPGRQGSWGGDSAYVSKLLLGGAPLLPEKPQSLPPEAYLLHADLTSPLVSPALWPEVLSKFPPTLLLTGTRAWDMSAAVQTHRQLIKAGATAELHLWDGMGHCFFLDEDLQESREAYDILVKFFDAHLGR